MLSHWKERNYFSSIEQGIKCLDEERKRVLSFRRYWLYSTFPLLLRGLFKYSLQFTHTSHQFLTISSVFFFPFWSLLLSKLTVSFLPCIPVSPFQILTDSRHHLHTFLWLLLKAQPDIVPKLSLLPPHPLSIII